MMANERPEKDWYRKNRPKKGNYNRRANWNDYQLPRIYMITMVADKEVTPLSEVDWQDGSFVVKLTNMGLVVDEELKGWDARWKELTVGYRVIMPDHIHFILNVRERLGEKFSKVISDFKGGCTRKVRQMLSASGRNVDKLSFFEKNFHDRILTGKGQLDAMISYIKDNPRRYLMKKRYPDLFRRINMMKIDGTELSAFGNLFLLREFCKEPVIIRSHYSEEYLKELRERWRGVSDMGGVLVSPFISEKEKSVMEETLAAGGKVIVIRDNGFPERFKPSGKLFDYCLEGQLLLIGPATYETSRGFLTREKCWEMNRIAEKICNISPETMLSLTGLSCARP